jgi:hypothetical protein
MQHKHHIARRRGFSSSLPWGNEKVSFRSKLGVSLKSLSSVLCLSRRESSHLLVNGSKIKSQGVYTSLRHWNFSQRLQQKICGKTVSNINELIKGISHHRFHTFMDWEIRSFARSNRWRILKNSSRSIMAYFKEGIPILQLLFKGGVL